MKRRTINVTEAARNFGSPVARLLPDREKVCFGRDLAAALAEIELPEDEARAWHRDLLISRKTLKAPAKRWR